MERHFELTNFIWSIADPLRHDYKQSEYGRIILPLTVLRRLDCVLEPTKEKVRSAYDRYKDKIDNIGPLLENAAKQSFYNTSRFDFEKLLADPTNIANAFKSYIGGFSPNARAIVERFGFLNQIDRLDDSNLLYRVVQRFAQIDLHPETIDNVQMGYIYEELIRRFSEQSNETAGEHFTPREVIELMVNLLFAEDDDLLRKKGAIRTLYDPACGTGGMLSVAERHLRNLNPDARLELFGQEINGETYATCVSDMMVKAHDTDNIIFGNTFTEDGLAAERFDYMLCNPPFGVDWKKYQKQVVDEADKLGFAGRFGAGTPRVSNGSLLFLQHMLARMKAPQDGGSRLAIVFNASPLFTGAAGTGESEIRRWIIENDWLEAIVALPDQLFYNTGISTYVWVLTNRKRPERQGKVQLIDGREFYRKMHKSLGDKRNELGPDDIRKITELYGSFEENEHSKIFPNEYFGYRRITVERPLRRVWHVNDDGIEAVKAHRTFEKLGKATKRAAPDAGAERQEAILRAFEGTDWPDGPFTLFDDIWNHYRYNLELEGLEPTVAIRKMLFEALGSHDPEADPIRDGKGRVQADTQLRDYENVPFTDDTDRYFEREVLPYVPDAWIGHDKTKVGYEIPFTREFYVYEPPRRLCEIDAEIEVLEKEILTLLREVSG